MIMSKEAWIILDGALWEMLESGCLDSDSFRKVRVVWRAVWRML